MPPEPVPGEPEWDDDPAWSRPDPMTPEEREAWLDHLAETDEPPGEEDWEDFAPLTAEEIAQTREGAAAGPAIWAAMAGRRGPGQPGSARTYPGESASTAAAFGSGMTLDVMPACIGLALSADTAAGDDDSYRGVSDDELLGVLAAWDRLEAHMAARKLAAVAELYRRNPENGCQAEAPGRMPEAYEEFTDDELASVLAESRAAAGALLDLARDLASGHDPGARLRHLAQIRHATCTSPVCRRPASQADYEHNTPYEAGGRTCLCNGGPASRCGTGCRRQQPRGCRGRCGHRCTLAVTSHGSDVKPPGHHAPPEVVPGPEAEVTADFEILGEVVADDPQRDHDLRAPGPERAVVLAVDQSLEDLVAVGLAVLGAQHHPVRSGAELRTRVAAVIREGRH